MKNTLEERVKAYQKIQEIKRKRRELFIERNKKISNVFSVQGNKSAMLDAIEIDYADKAIELEKELDKYDNMLHERNRKLYKLSKFDKKDILDAISYVLSEVYQEDFVSKYGTIYCPNESISLYLNDVGFIAPKSIFDTFVISFDGLGSNQRFGCNSKYIKSMILFQSDNTPFVSKDFITFYDESEVKSIDTGNYKCVYDFIDQLVDYKWIYKKDKLTRNDIFEQANDFAKNYQIPACNLSKTKVKK